MRPLYELHVFWEAVRHGLVNFAEHVAHLIRVHHEKILTEHESKVNQEFIEVDLAQGQKFLLLSLNYPILLFRIDRNLGCFEITIAQTAQRTKEERHHPFVNDEINWQARMHNVDLVHHKVLVMER